MKASTKRRRPLTMRLLNGIEQSLSIHAAGGPEDITGYDDEASQHLHAAITDAHEWVKTEIAAREARKSRA